MNGRLADLPLAARLGLAGFVLLLGGVYAAAQATLWLRDGGGRLPRPADVLAKYHGRPDASRLHDVLDLDRRDDDPRAMWWYLDPTGDRERIRERADRVLAWVEAGAPRAGWDEVATLLHEQGTCLQCHAAGGERADLPLVAYGDVQAVARPGRGMAWADLLVSAHNHVFAFAVAGLLLALAGAFTTLRGPVLVGAVLATFLGAALDVGGWFLTRWAGAPWHGVVWVAGAVFALGAATLALAVLDEVLLRGRIAARLGVGRPREG